MPIERIWIHPRLRRIPQMPDSGRLEARSLRFEQALPGDAQQDAVDFSATLVALLSAKNHPSDNGGRSPRELNRADVLISNSLAALRVRDNRNVGASSRTIVRNDVALGMKVQLYRLFKDELSCAIKEFLS
jgi:hypothetical protein